MKNLLRSIRPFIGTADYQQSRAFYREVGFEEKIIDAGLSVFTWDKISFYLQNYYVKDWVDNTMLFIEVSNTEKSWEYLDALHLPEKYPGVRLSAVRYETWGSECFLHDPAGILWHFGSFK